MAIATYTSGDFSTTNQYIKFKVIVDLVSQDIANNSSVVNVRVNIWRTNSGYTTYGSGTLYTNIDGVQRNVSITPSHKITNSAITLFNQNISVGHNSDGSKTLVLGLSISHNQFNSSPTNVEFRCNLKTIPRASSFTLSSSSVNAGTSITGTISRANGSFKHDVYLGFGTKTWTLATNVDTSFSATIPMDTLKEIPNAIQGQGNIRVVTKNGNSEVGQKATTFYISAPSNIVPSFSSLAIERVDNGVPSAWGVYVKGKSKAKLTINGASGIHGSTINKYEISGGGYSTTGSSFTTGVLNTAGTITFTGVVTDSRGRTATKTVNCSVVDYFSPSVREFVIGRCNSSGTLTDEGTYVKVKAVLNYASVSSKNTISAKVEYKTKSATTWTSAGAITSGKEVIIGGGKIDANTSYDIRLVVQDAFETVTVPMTIPTASTTIDFKSGGMGIAIGKVAEKNGFEVNWDSNFLTTLKVKGNDVYHTGRKPSKADVGLGNVNNWGASSDKAANSTSQYATTNMVAQVRAEAVKFDHTGDTSGNHHPRIYVSGKDWLRAPSGGFVPYSHQKGYLGLADKAWYDLHTVHLNSKPIGGKAGSWWNCIPVVGGDGVTEMGRYIDLHDSSTSTADFSIRLTCSGSTLNCSGTFTQGSDRSFKEDISYLDELEILTAKSDSTSFKDFIKDTFRPCTFRYKGTEEVVTGFVAQDIWDNPIGKLFIRETDFDVIDKSGDGDCDVLKQEKKLIFDLSGYVTIVAKALQEEIREKDKKISELENRIADIEKLIEAYVN